MKLLCNLLGHKIIFEKTKNPKHDDNSGKFICKRCGYIQGGAGKVVIVNYIDNLAGKGGISGGGHGKAGGWPAGGGGAGASGCVHEGEQKTFIATGKYIDTSHICKVCYGLGVLRCELIDPQSKIINGEVKCDSCKGTGKCK